MPAELTSRTTTCGAIINTSHPTLNVVERESIARLHASNVGRNWREEAAQAEAADAAGELNNSTKDADCYQLPENKTSKFSSRTPSRPDRFLLNRLKLVVL